MNRPLPIAGLLLTNGRGAAALALVAAGLIGFGPLRAGATTGDPEFSGPVELTARWIWHQQKDYHPYNQTVVARKSFRLKRPERAVLRITADSFYRVFINQRWVNDGPCRSWPEHYQYDLLDVSTYLVDGDNEIQVIARYFGVGDFHRVPQQAGLWAQLDVQLAGGKTTRLMTDRSWHVAEAQAWISNTPKASIQMEPCELFDARLQHQLKFRRAAVLFEAEAGPWKDLNPRDVALMTREPVGFRSFLGAQQVRADGLNFCLPAARLAHPGLIEANHTVSCAGGMATLLNLDRETTVQLQTDGLRVAIDGQWHQDNRFQLGPGRHLVLALVQDIFGHNKEKSLRFLEPLAPPLVNPLEADHENPWCYIRFPEFNVATNDLLWMQFSRDNPDLARAMDGYTRRVDQLLESVKDLDSFRQALAGQAELMASKTMFVEDFHWPFLHRQVVGDAVDLVRNPGGLLHNNASLTTVLPGTQGDVELLYDLGQQNCGYYGFELVADAGVIVDIFSLEYIAPDGRIQHSWGNRNGLRYITQQGVNRFTSLKRRSGRYVFITFRHQTAPVQIRQLGLVESTYPVNQIGTFSCSDTRLDQIWDISTRTLKLCMEDTYTDCPLYEQTHWVGDARNESLLAYGVFGAEDLARRCIRISAQSLEHYPITGCQTPSSWDVLIPAWSLLWGISVWDYYWATGDEAFLREVYPAVLQNLRGAESFVNDQNLFSAPFWNFFDWTGIDANRKTVLHNSMFVVGAIDAALKIGDVLGDDSHRAWLTSLRSRLVQAINALWDTRKNAYPDSIHEDGQASSSTCQHTSFLAILFDIIQKENLAAATRNLTDPPEKMVQIGSPFAALYLYETFEKLGLDDAIVREIYRNYLPMLESGATTVWESFPSGTTGSGGFPTRSHCHAWSSAPSRFLNRIVLGIKETAPAARSVEISPRLNGLTWARGTTATAQGPVSVSWKRDGDTVALHYTAPASVKVTFVPNDTLQDLTLIVNGQKWE